MKTLPDDIEKFRRSYADMFGSVPPQLNTRFEITTELDEGFMRLHEQIRAHVFSSTAVDPKTMQLMAFGMFLCLGEPAAELHALAARRAGASFEEIHLVTELAATTAGFGKLAVGDKIIAGLKEREAGKGKSAS